MGREKEEDKKSMGKRDQENGSRKRGLREEEKGEREETSECIAKMAGLYRK